MNFINPTPFTQVSSFICLASFRFHRWNLSSTIRIESVCLVRFERNCVSESKREREMEREIVGEQL